MSLYWVFVHRKSQLDRVVKNSKNARDWRIHLRYKAGTMNYFEPIK